MVTASEFPAAWENDTMNFPENLPAGTTWPELGDDALGRGEFAEEGLTAMMASEYWLCAWEKEYLDAANKFDTPKQSAALDELRKYVTLPAIVAHFPDRDVWEQSVLTPAEAGNTSGVQTDFAQCGDFVLD
jgi:hypothetical protein